ncbi:hypothetical protein [Streptomyces sp. NPDC048481]|uniref:hypothetical protein n=1 Tax=Streptomyces sp. NPDC048481 TaxID=3365557 RepID=UPI00371D309F
MTCRSCPRDLPDHRFASARSAAGRRVRTVAAAALAAVILTVANSSDEARPFAARPPGAPDGTSPVPKDPVALDVTAPAAPAAESAVGRRQDGRFPGLFDGELAGRRGTSSATRPPTRWP